MYFTDPADWATRLGRVSYPRAEMQSVYSIDPADWAVLIKVLLVLLSSLENSICEKRVSLA